MLLLGNVGSWAVSASVSSSGHVSPVTPAYHLPMMSHTMGILQEHGKHLTVNIAGTKGQPPAGPRLSVGLSAATRG